MRRRDLEPNGVECIWVELTLRQKHVLFGVFYRPPSADALYFSSIEDSIHLAVDTNILTPLQSGFIPGDSTVNQLTYLYDSFSHALDFGKEVRVVFCDIS